MPHRRIRVTSVALCTSLTLAGAANAELFVYPKNGQSQEQLAQDKAECNTWAIQETGYDPSRPVVAEATTQGGAQGGEMVGGAARGAALGAIGGAIAGNAGKGAAIGAGVGAGGGLLKRGARNAEKQRSDQAAIDRATAANAEGKAKHQRAMTACLEARGYSVN